MYVLTCVQFTQFYYNTFDTSRASLQSLYGETSMLTWEDKQFLGPKAITEHLTTLPFQSVAHKVTSLDAQPSVTGQLVVDGGENPLQFSQVFQLSPTGGSYFVQNDIFKLNYG
ncbi:nuclear transport factor 2 [Cantharellus anzutake]|uniref:nuclear transport factor 2 n=1 Tax=Cantharellus anzutake TaxID=1750568 RepID=UPI0019047F14|nr:nuclear transport factor 2 [Cantharellus anzutake]KAF8334293.1 nuclear transport factor 2 [Cantharellus anzutake]